MKNLNSILILSGTGTGKTWMAGGLLRRIADIDFWVGKTMSHVPYLYITRASVVTQTERVLARDFSLTIEDTSVINIEQLRSSAGKFWLKRDVIIVEGETQEKWTWKKNIQPAVIIWDECQALKNAGSQQHQIACAINDMGKWQPKQVFVSATPFTKVSEAKCFAVSTHKDLTYILGKRSGFPEGTVLTNETWVAYAKVIAGLDPQGRQQDPTEYNEAAVDRLMTDLDDWVVRVKGVRPQFEADNRVQMIDFQTKEEYNYYHAAWERYLEEKRKLEAKGLAGVPVGMQLLVRFLKFRMAAEYCRHKFLVERMVDIVTNGKAAVCALSFKGTIIAMVMEFEKRGIKRDQISIIWGGGQTQLTDQQKKKAKIKSLTDEQLETLGQTQEDLLAALDLEEVEDRELLNIPEHLRLGLQSFEERQREIDKFQSGKTLYCIYTLKAGGVGLSLHHTDELTIDWNRGVEGFQEWYNQFKDLPDQILDSVTNKLIDNPKKPRPGKCRRKESGYVIEEDIKFIPTREREALITPTWSPIELVQGVGRVPRLTSLSRSVQKLIFYTSTIEGRVASIAGKGLRCLTRIVKHKEPWSSMAIEQPKEKLEQFVDTLPEDGEEDGTGLVDEGGDE